MIRYVGMQHLDACMHVEFIVSIIFSTVFQSLDDFFYLCFYFLYLKNTMAPMDIDIKYNCGLKNKGAKKPILQGGESEREYVGWCCVCLK